jgi:hypothetical protein
MRAWIDRTNDGLSGMPADGISLPRKGDFGTSRWAARRLVYINHATGRKDARQPWPRYGNAEACYLSASGVNRKTFARSSLEGFEPKRSFRAFTRLAYRP